MEERIIFAVSSKRCLFDTTADSYSDINTKSAALRQVSTIVGLPEEDCRRKWRGLRDRYQRERRAEKEKKRSGSAASGQQPWHFCHILSFLDPFIVPRATSGNFTARPSTMSYTSVVASAASRPSTSPTNATITSTGGVRPSTTSSTSMTTTGAAMEDDEMEEAPLDLGPPEIIMNLTEVTTEDLVEQDVAVERNRERNEEEQRHTRRHRRYQIHSTHFSRGSSKPSRGMQPNLMLTVRRMKRPSLPRAWYQH
ncbi:uncharacterized protein LOC121838845 [Oncorhynchus tshawytscha]|uniref:uncharacterized protein LOC121838845 n=1 Tax=Oncorhynchus tshawytscha TaxID=74940 RepID=UPI001C3D86CA|nr:uncharacterized protein LOC121838845 [Oncorhynchus tshawytscha]